VIVGSPAIALSFWTRMRDRWESTCTIVSTDIYYWKLSFLFVEGQQISIRRPGNAWRLFIKSIINEALCLVLDIPYADCLVNTSSHHKIWDKMMPLEVTDSLLMAIQACNGVGLVCDYWYWQDSPRMGCREPSIKLRLWWT
jgi:hypothetical protein